MSSGNIELRLNFSLCNHLNSSLKFILKFSLIFSVLLFQKFYKRTLLNLLLLKIDQQSCSLNYDSKNTRPNLLANTSAICPLRRNRRSVITSRTFKPISWVRTKVTATFPLRIQQPLQKNLRILQPFSKLL